MFSLTPWFGLTCGFHKFFDPFDVLPDVTGSTMGTMADDRIEGYAAA
jgi:hypothetical protein